MDEPVVHFLNRQGGAFRMFVQSVGQAGEAPACAAVIGEPIDECLVRVHSRCLYSEAFGSQDCDCQGQLSRSLDLIQGERAGVLIYLDQEGRGSGLLAKARGYVHSQATGADTYESYAALNLPADSRTYAAAADLLKHLGLSRIRLLTNNPDKVAALEAAGLVVKQEPLHVPVGEKAAAYMEAKRARGHARPARQHRLGLAWLRFRLKRQPHKAWASFASQQGPNDAHAPGSGGRYPVRGRS